MRFNDSTLIRILRTMRIVGGQALSNRDWQALLATEQAEGQAGDYTDFTGWYHTCYVWSVTSMDAFMESRESARQMQRPLFYIQSVDTPQNLLASDKSHLQ